MLEAVLLNLQRVVEGAIELLHGHLDGALGKTNIVSHLGAFVGAKCRPIPRRELTTYFWVPEEV